MTTKQFMDKYGALMPYMGKEEKVELPNPGSEISYKKTCGELPVQIYDHVLYSFEYWGTPVVITIQGEMIFKNREKDEYPGWTDNYLSAIGVMWGEYLPPYSTAPAINYNMPMSISKDITLKVTEALKNVVPPRFKIKVTV